MNMGVGSLYTFAGVNQVNPSHGDWYFYICAAGFVLLAVQKVLTEKSIGYYFKIFHEFDLEKVQEDVNRIHLQNFAILYFNYLITFTISILLIFNLFFGTVGFGLNFFSFVKLFLGLLIFLVSKHLMHQVFLSLFTSSVYASLFTKNFEISNSFIGIFLLPLLFIGYYTMDSVSVIVWIALALSTVFYLFNLTKLAWFMGKFSRLSAMFILIYLCSVEILPVVWITAWLSNKV